MIDALLTEYMDSGFLDALVALAPAVGAGVVTGFIFAVLGWVFGLVWGLFRIGIE